MADYTSSKTNTAGGIGFIVAAAIVVLVLLYALFVGGSVETTADPASLGDAGSAPVVDDTTPVAPVSE